MESSSWIGTVGIVYENPEKSERIPKKANKNTVCMYVCMYAVVAAATAAVIIVIVFLMGGWSRRVGTVVLFEG